MLAIASKRLCTLVLAFAVSLLGSACSTKSSKLCQAVRAGDLEQVKVLLREGADKNTYCGLGTALDEAVTSAHEPLTEEKRLLVVRALLEEGATPDPPENKKTTTLIRAIRAGRSSAVVELLLKAGADPNREDESERTALTAAAEEGNVEIIRLLIKSGASPTITTMRGDTALTAAAGQGKKDAVAVLLEKSVSSDELGNALIRAASSKSTETARLLISAGANPNALLKTRYMPIPETPLMEAARAGDASMVRLLIEAKADPNFSWYGVVQTPLMLAAGGGFDEVVWILSDAGADLTKRDKDGKSAADLAEQGGKKDLARAIRQRALSK
jgi:ankyrin repeat protein